MTRGRRSTRRQGSSDATVLASSAWPSLRATRPVETWFGSWRPPRLSAGLKRWALWGPHRGGPRAGDPPRHLMADEDVLQEGSGVLPRRANHPTPVRLQGTRDRPSSAAGYRSPPRRRGSERPKTGSVPRMRLCAPAEPRGQTGSQTKRAQPGRSREWYGPSVCFFPWRQCLSSIEAPGPEVEERGPRGSHLEQTRWPSRSSRGIVPHIGLASSRLDRPKRATAPCRTVDSLYKYHILARLHRFVLRVRMAEGNS